MEGLAYRAEMRLFRFGIGEAASELLAVGAALHFSQTDFHVTGLCDVLQGTNVWLVLRTH